MSPIDYDSWYDSPRGRWIGDTENLLLADLLAPRSGEQLLDVGCGTGWFTRRMARQDGLVVTGVDIDADALAFASQSDPRTRYAVADAMALPFGDDSFERVMSVTALCFVPDWPRALAEIVRVARKRFVVGLLNRYSLLALDKGRHGGQGAYRGAHWHSRQEVARALAALPVGNVQFQTAILLSSGSTLARWTQRHIGNWTPFGSFLAVAGDKLQGNK